MKALFNRVAGVLGSVLKKKHHQSCGLLCERFRKKNMISTDFAERDVTSSTSHRLLRPPSSV
eukprot:scaffold20907_cov108-Skeletonema_menzelii.AAC.1